MESDVGAGREYLSTEEKDVQRSCVVVSTMYGLSSTTASLTMSFPEHENNFLPCLPVSKGDIKKTAQTRFVNSSPRSYRLMPASVESSDRTSFIEKSSCPNHSPMKFMLEVAELWEISKRSELECNFTLAKSRSTFALDNYIKETIERSPISHSAIIHAPAKQITRKPLKASRDITESFVRAGMGQKLLQTVQNFFNVQEMREHFSIGIAGLLSQKFTHPNTDCVPGSVVPEDDHEYESISGANLYLTPLVKRLSVTGLEDQELIGTGKSQSTSKRPNSNPEIDCAEEPLQKRPFSYVNIMQHSIQPG